MQLTRNFPQTWTFGTLTQADRTSLRAFYVNVTEDAGAVRYSTIRRLGAGAGYQVPTGKTLIITAFRTEGVGTQSRVSLGYSNSDRAFSNATDGANPVNLDAETADGDSALNERDAGWARLNPIFYEIPAGKFPRIVAPIGTDTLHYQLFGVEV